MIGQILEQLRSDGRWRTEHLEFRFTPRFSSVRQARFSKVRELIRVYVRICKLVAKCGRADLLIYPSGGPQTVPVVRDILLLPVVRLVAKRLWVQFHAAGIAERLDAKGGVLERLLRAVYRSADGAIVMTEYNRRDPESLGIPEIEVIPHRLEDENPGDALPDYSVRPLKILHVGHLYELKGTPQLVEAFGSIAPSWPEWRLVLIGEFLPPYSEQQCRARCRELGIEDRVEIVGALRGRDKAGQFRAAHLFVFPSIAPYESFGLVMAEAMMWGLPLIVSDWRGNRDVAGCNAESYGVGPDAVRNLAEALGGFFRERGKWEEKARLSRQRFVSLYRLEKSSYPDFAARTLGLIPRK